MKVILKHLVLATLLLPACQSAEDKATETTGITSAPSARATAYPAYFRNVLQAHGGLEQWQKLGTMQFQLTTNGSTETHIIDLKNRKDLVKAAPYTIGYDGEQVWVSPKKAAYPGKSARFYHNLYFYFVSIPFVLADPGVSYEQLPDTELQDKQYKTISITFGEGVGATPKDQYRLLVNRETDRVEWLLHTVTFFDGKPSDKFNALKYEEYLEHEDLVLPRKLTGYKYENGQIGDMRYSVTINNMQLKEERPDQQQFDKPEQAEVDAA